MKSDPSTHSLPDREALAKAELGVTVISRALAWFLAAVFLFMIGSVPVVQQVHEMRAPRGASRVPQAYDIFRALPKAVAAFAADGGALWRKVFAANRVLVDEIKAYETALEEESALREATLPQAQHFLTRWFGVGNEKAYVGRSDSVFFRPDVDYVVGQPFLPRSDATTRRPAGARAGASIAAIVDFRDQLARRGARLIVLPTPVSPMIHPERFADVRISTALQNPSFDEWKGRLEEQGVVLCDVAAELARARTKTSQYLSRDTHWTPHAMELAAEKVAALIGQREWLELRPPAGFLREPAIVRNLGDVARMLRLPDEQTLFAPETVTINSVQDAKGSPWAADQSADVLVLGDSFSNIYSLDALGWGTGAGFAEQLSYSLQRPVDAILRNDAGAFATRELLAAELARGRDRLAGKKVVVWQFAIRELVSGHWKSIKLELGSPPPSRFIAPARGRELMVTATIQAKGPIPRPGSVPYKDHVVAFHLTAIESPTDASVNAGEALVYVASMSDNVLTSSAHWRVGDRVTLRLRAWAEVEEKVGAINRGELDDEALRFEEPAWGEPLR